MKTILARVVLSIMALGFVAGLVWRFVVWVETYGLLVTLLSGVAFIVLLGLVAIVGAWALEHA